MGEYITVGESLLITVFSMIVVFVVLAAISYLIDLLKIVTNNKKEVIKPDAASAKKVESRPAEQTATVEESQDDEELVAVIAAAIAASLGVGVTDINIKSINRVSPTQPVWAKVGRQEYISQKL